jgi:hypothetical protein
MARAGAETLLADATALLTEIETAELPPSRTDYLTAQCAPLRPPAASSRSNPSPYREEVQLCFDIDPVKTPDRSTTRPLLPWRCLAGNW